MSARRLIGTSLVWLAAASSTPGPAAAAPKVERAAESDMSASETHAESHLSLRVVASGPSQPWILQVRNTSSTPFAIVADERLLWFEVSVPGRRQTETCRLPTELVPPGSVQRAARVLRPGEVFAQRFDPRFFCFSPDAQTVLVPGAAVTPHFGWPDATKTTWRKGKKVTITLPAKAPFVATEFVDEDADDQSRSDDSADAEPLQLKNLVASTVILDSRYSEWTGFEADDEDSDELELRMLKGSDAHSERDASITLALTNNTDDNVELYFRRGLTEFVVLGPDGPKTCAAEEYFGSPARQAFITVRAKRSYTLTTRLVEVCPRGTFARPGLYKISARLTAKETGEQFGINAFVGELESASPALVRVRKGEAPFRIVYRKTRTSTPSAPTPAPAPTTPVPPARPPPPKRAPAPAAPVVK